MQADNFFFKAAFENAGVCMAIVEDDATIFRINREFECIFGYSRKELEGRRSLTELAAFEGDFKGIQQYKRLLRHSSLQKVQRGYEAEMLLKDGRKKSFLLFAGVVAGTRKSILSLIEAPENRKNDEALRESEERFRTILEDLPGGVFAHDLEGRIVLVNKAASENTGYTKEELLGMRVSDIDPASLSRDDRQNLWHALEFGQSMTIESTHIRKDGSQYTAEIHLNAVTLGEQPIILPIVLDITARKQAEETMFRQQQAININNRIANVFLTASQATIFQEVLDVVLDELGSRFGLFGYLDDNGDLVCPSMTREVWYKCNVADKRIVFFRSDWGGIWGRALIEKRTICSNEGLKLPEGHVAIENALAVPILHHEELIGLFVVADKKGGYTAYDRELLEIAAVQTAPILNAHLEETREKKERRKLEAQLRQAQKMEAIGTLAGGIAHDFNNILSSVIGYAELSIDEVEKGSLLHRNLSQILSSGNRAKDLVKQILAISRREEEGFQATPVLSLVKEVLKMMRSTFPSSIEIKENIIAEKAVVKADPTQLYQVIVNLAANAKQAIIDESGVIQVDLKAVSLDQSITRRYPEMMPGDYALITVSDTGCGISAKYLDRIFEPYFTTKEKGAGTGLGLSVVHGIVKSHKGYITVYSEPGNGTSFNVYLPLTDPAPAESAGQKIEPLPSGNERVLLVDDEESIVKMQQEILERLGYIVTAKTSGLEALEVFRSAPYEFDILITDMTMPDITGDKIALYVKDIRLNLPVILCTGFSDKIEGFRNEDLGVEHIMMKPVTRSDLARRIRDALDSFS